MLKQEELDAYGTWRPETSVFLLVSLYRESHIQCFTFNTVNLLPGDTTYFHLLCKHKLNVTPSSGFKHIKVFMLIRTSSKSQIHVSRMNSSPQRKESPSAYWRQTVLPTTVCPTPTTSSAFLFFSSFKFLPSCYCFCLCSTSFVFIRLWHMCSLFLYFTFIIFYIIKSLYISNVSLNHSVPFHILHSPCLLSTFFLFYTHVTDLSELYICVILPSSQVVSSSGMPLYLTNYEIPYHFRMASKFRARCVY